MSIQNTAQQTLLALLALPGVGRQTAIRAIACLRETPSNAIDFSNFVQNSTSRRLQKLTSDDCAAAWNKAANIQAAAEQAAIEIVSHSERGYPSALAQLADPPAVLFLKGDRSCLASRCVAVIGSRDATARGLQWSTYTTQTCVEAGFAVVSGLAAGIDTAAHKACLDAGGQTIAVMAHGLDQVFPPENQPLADKIVDAGGLLMSEYLPGTPPIGPRFVERDRLQSGLSEGVILVESSIDGGSMHTIRYAHDQSRLIAAWDSETNTSDGNTAAISEHGAMAIKSHADIKQFLKMLKPPITEPKSLWG